MLVRVALICIGLAVPAVAGSAGAETSGPAPAVAECRVELRSDPPGAEVRLGDRVWTTPADVQLPLGSHPLAATLDDSSPLSHDLEIAAGDTLTVEFVLLSEAPERPSAEDLELSYQPTVPPRLMAEAEQIRSNSRSLTEIFSVMPLALGVTFKIGDSHDAADAMILSGVALMATSWVVGNRLYDRRVRDIETYNEDAAVRNAAAKAHNAKVERAIDARHAELLEAWEAENADRGRVNVTRR